MTSKATDDIINEEWVGLYRRRNPAAERWAAGYGVIEHTPQTQHRIFRLAELLRAKDIQGDGVPFFEALYAADRVASAAMWIAVHETYARNVYLDGRDLAPDDFKSEPEGHTGGVLNMIPGYVGYMAVNLLTGFTRSWVMGQGHCVAAIDTVNLLLDNMTPAHARRYSVTGEGLTRYVRDFYSYRLDDTGKQDSPLGSHVNANTAGGMAEGGYLGFVELEYVHMPLPGERLVAFLSDGAFEEQRGSDWVPRWWRAEDSGLVLPIMINNGRRIDQRTTMSQEGGVDWFVRHLELNSFDPIIFDGRDPAAFTWAVCEMETRLQAAAEAVRSRGEKYPVRMPYGIAVAPKGAGFYGAGTNLAHNLPLGKNPHTDIEAMRHFNESARRLWVPLPELQDAIGRFERHQVSGRPKEKDHPLAHRDVKLTAEPPLVSRPVPADRSNMDSWRRWSPMYAVDEMFLATVQANPHLRPRVGNPDEMRSNRLTRTLEALKFRVTAPEKGVPEDVQGAVVTALNEEAVAAAALGNKGGINLIATYEAFGTKMQGVVRQEIIFSNHCQELTDCRAGWLSVPLVLTSHTWENAKNELSHQDTSMAEAMMGEVSDVSRVVFVPDYNTAAVVMRGLYRTRGEIWTIVIPKYETIPDLFTVEEAGRLLEQGALCLDWAGLDIDRPEVILTAIGAYQLEEVIKASFRLRQHRIAHSVVYLLEPGRFRLPRSAGERRHLAPEKLQRSLYPEGVRPRVFVSHTRPQTILGLLQNLNTGERYTAGLGFIVQGGTLTTPGLLFLNRCTWAHILARVGEMLGAGRDRFLDRREIDALDGRTSPEGVIIASRERNVAPLPG
ncbi:MAG: xylulose 5-phosphate 3-epimerase [Chloroflexi bacterium]|nr:xylulose 5-phosphate 3-epimerase [Chloroflexota bacterium]